MELVRTLDAASVLVVHRWRKNRDHPSRVETAPLRIPETYVLYNYNVKIYIAGETTVGPASRRRSLKKEIGSSAREEEEERRRTRNREKEERGVKKMPSHSRLSFVLYAHVRDAAQSPDKWLKNFNSLRWTI